VTKEVNNKITFGTYESTCVLLVILSTQIFLNLPRFFMETAWTAGWILTVYITVLAFLIFQLIAYLYRSFEGWDLLDLGEYVGGAAGRIIVGLVFLAVFIFITSVVLREFSENIKIISLNRSPISFVTTFFMIGMVVAAYIGIEAIARFSAIAVPAIVVGYISIIAGSATYFDVSRLFPILGNGPKELFIKNLRMISVYSGLLMLYFLYPIIKKQVFFKRVGFRAIAMAGFLMTIGTLAFSLIFQYPTGTENFLPVYQMARLIQIGRFIARVESIFVFMWVTSALMYLSTLLFFICYTFKKAFRLEYYRPLVFPASVLIFAISFMPDNLIKTIALEDFYRHYAWITSFLLPLILLAAAGLKRKICGKAAVKP
jgi:spore germination protein (amino acid permease)